MGRRRIAAIALSGALVAGGTGAAIGAVGGKDGERAEQAVLDDAAERLDVAPEKLREALRAARDAQLDEAVKAGRLTHKRADAIKAARARSGRVLGPPAWRGRHHGRFGPRRGAQFGLRHGLIDEIATALATTPAKLFESLRSGKSIAEVAQANGKSLGEVRSAVRTALKTRLDKAVEDGELTQKQVEAILERVDEKLEAIEAGKAPHMRGHGRRGEP